MQINKGPLGPAISPDPIRQDLGQSYTSGFDLAEQTGSALSFQRIAICSVGELFGGVERHILGLLSGFRKHRITVLLILFHDSELAAQARQQGIEPIILPKRNRSLLATSRQLAGTLEQWQIQIVHVHGYKATVFCTLARYWYPFTVVKTEHGLPEPMAGNPLQALRDRFYHLLDSMATRRAGATVCYVTEELRTHYRRAHAGLQGKVIPNGVANIDRFQLQCPPELHEDWFNLIIVGRLDRVKGHHLAIESLAAPGLSPAAHLHIVGTGPCEAELRTLAEIHGIAHRVHFLGFRQDIYGFIAHCHVLLMPSLHEGLPYTLLEAMALGTPIIASRVGGLAEVLRDGVTALLVPAGDVAALTRAIIRLQGDPKLCRCLGEQSQRLQQDQYSLEAMTAQYLRIYRGLLAANTISL